MFLGKPWVCPIFRYPNSFHWKQELGSDDAPESPPESEGRRRNGIRSIVLCVYRYQTLYVTYVSCNVCHVCHCIWLPNKWDVKKMRCTSKNHNLRKSSCNQIRIAKAGLSVRCSSVLVETLYPPSPEPPRKRPGAWFTRCELWTWNWLGHSGSN